MMPKVHMQDQIHNRIDILMNSNRVSETEKMLRCTVTLAAICSCLLLALSW